MDDFRRLKEPEVGICIITLLVYVAPISDKPEFGKIHGSSTVPDHLNLRLTKHHCSLQSLVTQQRNIIFC